mgnify:FL=1
MKKIDLKYLTFAFVISFVLSFMLYLYEPILTYSSNINDFWFDFNLMISNIILYMIIIFVFLILVYFLLYLFLRRKNIKMYKIILVISFILFLYTYIQGNYLVGSLPQLNGDIIDWSKYGDENIISILTFLLVVIGELALIKKFKIDKTIKINCYMTIIVFFMLFTSFISILCNKEIYKDKSIEIATTKNINNVSTDKNFFIFLVDSVDSREFAEVVNNNLSYKETFNDFTYYPDTTSGYLFTRDSIPFILSGIWNQEETDFVDYYNDAFNNSKLFKKLTDENYNMNFYEYEIYSNNRNFDKFDNIKLYSDKIDSVSFFKQFTKYILYKYLPYPLKKYSKIETASFDSCKIEDDIDYFKWSNKEAYNNLINNKLEFVDDKYFQFLHIEGGHVPFDYDEDVNIIENGTYKQKLTAVLKVISKFINRLKENNVYDNSVIIILADHGEGKDTLRQNPILYIKGINEHHEMYISDIPVAYEDLIDAYISLLENKNSTELFLNLDKNRPRRVLNNLYTREIMIEWYQYGKAWDNDTFKASGREFRR